MKELNSSHQRQIHWWQGGGSEPMPRTFRLEVPNQGGKPGPVYLEINAHPQGGTCSIPDGEVRRIFLG